MLRAGFGRDAQAYQRTRPVFPAAVFDDLGSFEDWEPQETPFDAVVAVNALHWIEPSLRYTKPAALLRPGGAMVAGSCRWSRPAGAHPFWTDVQQDYRAVGFEGDPRAAPSSSRGCSGGWNRSARRR